MLHTLPVRRTATRAEPPCRLQHRRADPLLQRGTCRREGGRRTSTPACRMRPSWFTTTTRRTARARPRSAPVPSVRSETLQGKGHVVRRMFADVEADIYVLVDGDDTYDPAAAPTMVRRLIENQLDMVTAVRLPSEQDAYRLGHRIGNRAAELPGVPRVRQSCQRRAVRLSRVQPALRQVVPRARRRVRDRNRIHHPRAGAEDADRRAGHARIAAAPPARDRSCTPSRDGLRILRTIMMLVKQERPLQSFGLTGAVLLAAGLGLGLPVVLQFLRSGMVPRLPTALLATGLVLAFIAVLRLRPRARAGRAGTAGAEAAGLSVASRDRERRMTARHLAGAAGSAGRRLRRRCGDPVARPRRRDRGGDPFGAGADRRVAPCVHRRSGIASRKRWRGSRPKSPGGRMRPWWRWIATTVLPADAIAVRRSGMAASSSAWTTTPSSPTHTTLARAVAALDDDPTLAAIGCRILLHAMRRGRSFVLGLSGQPAAARRRVVRCGHLRRRRPCDPPHRLGRAAAMTRRCSSAGRNSTSACAPSSGAGASAIAATSRCATRSAPSGAVAWSGTRWFHFVRNRLYIDRKWGAGMAGAAAALRVLSDQGRPQWPAAADAARLVRGGPHVIRPAGAATFAGCTQLSCGSTTRRTAVTG